jgi:S-adenosylmethionine:tRNA ribosyltransferase-isomerase
VIAAATARSDARAMRLLRVSPSRRAIDHHAFGDLPALLRAGDVLVVNDAATVPGSLRGSTARGNLVEARLAGRNADGTWRAVLFGAGDWRTRTEDRPRPPRVSAGDRLSFDGLRAVVTEVEADSPRLVTLSFADDGSFWPRLYRAGHPVQYAHTAAPLALWDVQTAYAARPWAAEAPSAGFGLTWEIFLALRARGVAVAPLTHAAGLSSTGDLAIDARLPMREAYDIPAATVRAIGDAKARGGRIVALGTTSARALEGSAAETGALVAGAGETDLVFGPDTRRRVVDGIITGVHDAGTSHFRLLQAFAPSPLLAQALDEAEVHGYRGHEFGDALLVLE